MSSLNLNTVVNVPVAQTHEIQKNDEPTLHQSKSMPKEVPLQAVKTEEYNLKASKLIQDAVRLASAKQNKASNNVELIQIDRQESKDITKAKKVVNEAIGNCQMAMTSLSTIKISDFGDVFDIDNGKNVDKLFENVKGKELPQNKAYKILREAIQSQTQYLDGLRQLAKVSGHTPALNKAILQAELKHSEMGNFVAQMIAKKSEMQGLVIENLASLNAETKGHIGLLQNLFQEKLTNVFTALDNLPPAADANAFNSQINLVSSKISELEARINEVSDKISNDGIYTAKEGKQEVSFGLNKEILNAVTLSLENAKGRINDLKNPDYQATKLNFLKNIFPIFNIADFPSITQSSKTTMETMAKWNALRERLLNEYISGSGTLTPERLDKYIYFMDNDINNAMNHVNGLEGQMGTVAGIKQQEMLQKQLRGIVDLINNKPTEVAEFKLLLNGKTDQHQKTQYIKFAFDHNLDIASIVEASIRGIPPEDIETLVNVHENINKKIIGAGAINSVTQCIYTDADGFKKELIFKPENIARRGFRGLMVGQLGYNDTTNVARLNILSKNVGVLIGNPDITITSKAGCLDGRFGFFMEKAAGVTPNSLDVNPKQTVFTDKNGTKVSKETLISYLSKQGKLSDVQNSLKLELCALEWADAISGQTDRHGDNYLVDINPQTGKAHVTGIDNDTSFARATLGLGLIDKNQISPRNQSKLENLLRLDILKQQRIVNTAIFAAKKLAATEKLQLLQSKLNQDIIDLKGLDERYSKNIFGLNSCLTAPEFIDRKTFDSIIHIDVNAYKTMLQEKGLPSDMQEAAVSRLKNCIEHANNLQAKGLVIEDNQEGRDKLKNLSGNYFKRDFEYLD